MVVDIFETEASTSNERDNYPGAMVRASEAPSNVEVAL